MSLLHIQNLSIEFVNGDTTIKAVDNLSLQVNSGELLAIVGESGSGKSVTALSVMRLLPPTQVHYKGQIGVHLPTGYVDILQLPPAQLQGIRGRHIGMVFQEPMSSLNPALTCGYQLQEALTAHQSLPRQQAKQQALAWLQKVQLPQPEQLYHKYPHQLSGGQKQRVMIAMAMCNNPQLLICDEPTTALDVTVQKEILELIKSLQQQYGTAVIFISHDLGVVQDIADTIAVMYKGRLQEVGNAAAVLQKPASAYTRALLQCRPSLYQQGTRLPVMEALTHANPATPAFSPLPLHSSNILLQAKNICVQFEQPRMAWGKKPAVITAVNDVNLQVYEGETLGLAGESGSGKSTLGRTLLHLQRMQQGSLIWKGQDVTQPPPGILAMLRKKMQLVFQDPYASLNPRMNIGAAIAEPMLVHRLVPHKQHAMEKAIYLLQKTGLPADYYNRYPHQLSGGQRQRVVIARALALNPELLVCDESVSALDVSVQAQILNLLNDIKKEMGLTLLFISHDLNVIRYMSSHVAVMQQGRIVEYGETDAVYRYPQHAYTQQLLASVSTIVGY